MIELPFSSFKKNLTLHDEISNCSLNKSLSKVLYQHLSGLGAYQHLEVKYWHFLQFTDLSLAKSWP